MEAYTHGHLIVAWEDISNITAFSTLLQHLALSCAQQGGVELLYAAVFPLTCLTGMTLQAIIHLILDSEGSHIIKHFITPNSSGFMHNNPAKSIIFP